jgi:surfeit locus 1 family protein
MMSVGVWKFRPGLWPTVATLILLPLFVRLGIWQLDRADQKAALQQAYSQRRSEPAVDLATKTARRTDRQAMLWRECLLRGEYLPEEQYLLDNQIENEVVGYLVFTPFRLAGQDTVVLINRGWIPMGARRDVVPVFTTPQGPVEIRGMAKAPQSTGLTLGSGRGEKLGHGLVRLQHLDLAALARRKGWNLLPYVVRLEPDNASHFVRDWSPPGFGRERHLGYAFQWFLMAAVLVALYVVLNTRRDNRNED